MDGVIEGRLTPLGPAAGRGRITQYSALDRVVDRCSAGSVREVAKHPEALDLAFRGDTHTGMYSHLRHD